ncbi:MAG: hypothetical protein GX989_06300 [Firmicutes bacterium]|nr:hypothetical protein [Bacillota bacterium]
MPHLPLILIYLVVKGYSAATCEAREQVHCETRIEDDPADRKPVAGHVTMDGNLAGRVIVGSRRAVKLAERNLALHPGKSCPMEAWPGRSPVATAEP